MALPLFLHEYCVLASEFNSPDPGVVCRDMNRTFSPCFIFACPMTTFFFSFSSQSLGEVIKSLFLLPPLWWIPQIWRPCLSSPLDGICIFLSDWELPNDGNHHPLPYFKSFSKGTDDSFPFFSSEFHIYFTEDPASLHCTSVYWDLGCAEYCSRHLEIQGEQRLSSLLEEFTFWDGRGKRDRK